MEPDDDDRIYFLNTKDVVLEWHDYMRFNFEMLATDDPNKYVARVSTEVPKLYMKSVRYGNEV